jgi:6-phosphogluconolactonase/glucosamine-6-phosphate isomerase/deaminase
LSGYFCTVIEAARDIIFVCTGESKKQILSEIFPHDPNAARSPLPSAIIHPSSKEGRLQWFMDVHAAPDQFRSSPSSSPCL